MKSTGIVRKVDELGRIVLPIELRRSLGIDEKDPVEIFVDGDKIVMQKYIPNEEKENVRRNLELLMEDAMSGFAKETIQRAISLIK
ncbi:AbrB/MazE/SpoVT family DNA-binding domain-containing protein [Solibacillus sp. FSL K6-1523]|uniref:AbrB/MazE/SpoVT family DNA-binding domain-containing protein n=1 Tax=Solibacillus sp. FSL K6-1523 TaxID=2921471 RepID=UPI0030F96563